MPNFFWSGRDKDDDKKSERLEAENAQDALALFLIAHQIRKMGSWRRVSNYL